MDPRPLTAAGASLLAMTTLLGMSWAAGRHPWRKAGVAALVALLVALQHRTVWVALLLAAVYLAVAGLRAGGRSQLAAVLSSVSVVVLGPALVFSRVAAGSVVPASAGDDGTFLWRLDGWQQLVQRSETAVDVLVGQPFGTGFDRTIGGFLVTVNPHSQYVETYLRFGVVGAVAAVLLLAAAWRAAPAGAVAFGVSAAQARAVVVFVAAYGVTYRWDPAQMLILGTLLGAAAVTRTTVPAVPVPVPA